MNENELKNEELRTNPVWFILMGIVALVFLWFAMKPDVKIPFLNKSKKVLEVASAVATDTILFVGNDGFTVSKDPCNRPIPKGYNIRYNSEFDDYAISRKEGYIDVYYNETGLDNEIHWWLLETNKPTTFRDSCAAKKALFKFVNANNYKPI